MKMLRGIPTLLLLAIAVHSQVQAQYPGRYPPGQYPPGQYPPGQGPIPRIPGQTGPTGNPRTGQPQPDTRGRRSTTDAKSLLTTTAGILRRAAPNQLVIQADDHRVIWYRLASQLKVEKDGKDANLSEFALGDYLSVDSNGDDAGILTAVSVSWKKAGTPEDRAEAAKDWDLPRIETVARSSGASSASSPAREPGDDRPVLRRNNPEPQPDKPKEAAKETAKDAPKPEVPDNTPPATVMRPPDPKPDADDSGPPALRRGVPAPRRQTAEAQTAEATISSQPAVAAGTAAAEAPPQNIPVQDDPVIAKAREAALAYSETLPNYLVQQMTTRYQSDRPKAGWQALDVVTADVTYQDGRESYKNIKVGNKSVNKPMDEIEGTRSTGEFSTLLEQLLESGAAKFRSGGQDTIRNRSALVYSFEIPRELSRWRIEAPSQLYYPAIKGSIWIDKETSRVLRIEQQGRAMPALFPFDTVETSADYDFVRLGTTGPYLLPVEAEVLSCQRGISLCSRNKIEFRNYRKFGAETNITFDDKQ
ncbi:MAG: hypothetical protein JWO19_2031 [Bryobacterales bacterium]|nr:hypothetical protein [Bryobacterales bacterium]